MCTHVHISDTKWYSVGFMQQIYWIGATPRHRHIAFNATLALHSQSKLSRPALAIDCWTDLFDQRTDVVERYSTLILHTWKTLWSLKPIYPWVSRHRLLNKYATLVKYELDEGLQCIIEHMHIFRNGYATSICMHWIYDMKLFYCCEWYQL